MSANRNLFLPAVTYGVEQVTESWISWKYSTSNKMLYVVTVIAQSAFEII